MSRVFVRAMGISLCALVSVVLVVIALMAQAERSEHPVKESCEWMYQKALEYAAEAEKPEIVLGLSRSAAQISVAYSQLYMACQERNQ